jgi:hypothetical protein
VRGYLEQLDAWLAKECGDAPIHKKVFCFGTAHRHFAGYLREGGWALVESREDDNALREEVNSALFEQSADTFVFITEDGQYMTEIRNVERHGGYAMVIHGGGAKGALAERTRGTLASATRKEWDGPAEGRVYSAQVKPSGREVTIFPSMHRGVIVGDGGAAGGKVAVIVKRVHAKGCDVELRAAPVPHERYIARVSGEPFEDRVRVSIARVPGWGGIVYVRPPLNGLPDGRRPRDYRDGQEVHVELLAAREKGRVFRILEDF